MPRETKELQPHFILTNVYLYIYLQNKKVHRASFHSDQCLFVNLFTQ